jgi:UDP-N-acetylmuramoylalanine--D-glutamate ligase
MESYIADKKNIFLFQNKEDICVINGDNEDMKNFKGEIRSRLIKFSKDRITEGEGVYIENESIFVNNGIDEKKIIDLGEIKLIGKHNTVNIMAAIAAAVSIGIKIEIIKKAIIEFSGVAHRLEFVKEIDGVRYINDTAATTPEAGISALNSFFDPIILICGGSDKNLDMSEFAKEICKKVKNIIFLKGRATEKIIATMKEVGNCFDIENLKVAKSMEEAVKLARALSEKGDIILLSPGSASFGLFANEFDRGDKFKEVVEKFK